MIYWRLEGHKPVPCKDVIEWAKSFDNANRVVRQDTIGLTLVSTVFMAIDHSFGASRTPLLFETMVFVDSKDYDCRRTSTWDEALAAHEEVCALVEM